MTIPSILFVCTANRYRSPLAEGIFQKLLTLNGASGDQWRVGSAGTWVETSMPALSDAVQRGQRLGVHLAGHVSTEVSDEMLSAFDLIIVMETGHKEALGIEFPDTKGRVFLLSEIADHVSYDIPDPAKAMIEAEQIVRMLVDLLERGYGQICQLALEINEHRK